MKPVGTILQNARRQMGLSIDDIGRKTRIRVKYLRLIEDNKWYELPGATYAKGFVKSYANTVRLDPEKMIMLFRREYRDAEKQTLLPRGFVDQPLSSPGIVLTIKRIISKLVS